MKTAIFRDERGNALVLTALLAVLLCGVAALVIDVGMLFAARRSMVTAADAAALAGARELALTGEAGAAVAAARNYAQTNGAEITGDIAVETVTYNGEPLQAVAARIGVTREYFFARLLGLTDQEVLAGAVAAWGYPVSCHNVLPMFYILKEGDTLPEGEVLLLNTKEAPGNWGFISADSPGMKAINEILAGAPSEMFFRIGDEVTADTKTGNPMSRIDAVEARMRAAADPASKVSMEGIIPIIREITGQGHTEVVIVGFAPYEILDIITQVTKEENNRWYGRGSVYAHFMDAPRLYSVHDEGYDKKKEADEDYPKGTIVGRFLAEKFIPSRHYIEITQNPEHDFGLRTIKLIK